MIWISQIVTQSTKSIEPNRDALSDAGSTHDVYLRQDTLRRLGNMPRFRVVATVRCSKPLVRMIPMKLRKEARRLQKNGLQLDLEDVKVEEID